VVLPDPKRSENDLVVFLDERFASPDAAEAEQRGAVAALHRVCGDRQLHLLLPPQYRPLWQDIKGAAEKRSVQQTAWAVASDERKQRDKERKARMALRGPKVSKGGLGAAA
jgi:ATP-dependent RNA helicase DHX57